MRQAGSLSYVERVQNRGHTGRDLGGGAGEVAFGEDVRVARLRQLAHDQRGDGLGLAFFELGQLGGALLEIVVVLAERRVGDALLLGRSFGERFRHRPADVGLELGLLLVRQRLFPLRDVAALGVQIAAEVRLRFSQGFLRFCCALGLAGDFKHPVRRALAVAVVYGGVEEGIELIVFALGEGVELVVMALDAGERCAEPRCRRGVHAVHHGLDAELLRVDAAFLVDLRVAMKAGGDILLHGGGGKQIAGELFDGELIERQAGIESVDDPVAVFPN